MSPKLGCWLKQTGTVRGIILLLTAFAFGATARAHKTEVLIQSYSEIPVGQPIRLALISLPVNGSVDKFDEVSDLEVFPARENEERVFLGRVEVARALQASIPGEDITFRIPNQVILEPKKNLIPRIDLEKALLQESKKQCEDCQVSFREIKAPDLSKIEGTLRSWTLDFSNTRVQGNFIVPIKVELQNGNQNFFVTGTVDLYREALVARRTIAVNEKISKQDFEKKLININFTKGSLLKESEVTDQVAAHYLPAGQPFVSGDLKREIATTKGQLVKVLAGDDTLEVITQGTAEESGYLGDLIKVKNNETQKLMSGKIVDKGVVKLQ